MLSTAVVTLNHSAIGDDHRCCQGDAEFHGKQATNRQGSEGGIVYAALNAPGSLFDAEH